MKGQQHERRVVVVDCCLIVVGLVSFDLLRSLVFVFGVS